ncbi:glycoside hydrolase family 30 protein [Evansella cellulosilytica]|uniref:Glycoside hydrolase family 30 n=1 Tax=Evansella cellulosilytica (strain ATCC 21833 / DSM 2522 / FERM P-1141 / JCM 9156 / N-4) TaxID=649639 RepID=E6U0Q3_EVAC2|nr:glycoside hydrolase family 30 beta sandwich domain-containing protein [Evansella cellulosilytica]ADU29101.1 glycoside hydrolase family 30 [Evansella cellulosilytica DSM 2522]
MKAKQITTYSANGKTYPDTYEIPVTLEEDELFHLESGVLNIYPDITYQKIEGFGGSITESVAYLLQKMDEETSDTLLKDCFSTEGNRLKFLRMHMDSCDYSLEQYTAVADPIADPNLETFTIERDKKYAIPAIKRAMEISQEPLSIMVSPWSPPAAWKTPPAKPKNDASVYGDSANNIPKIDYETPQRCNGGSLKREYYPSWAAYLVKYVQAYMAEGLPVTMLSIQNETVAATPWDSCVWTAEEQKTFLRDHLYPAMEAASLVDQVKIFIWDHNKERVVDYSREIIDEVTDKMIDGIAFHWYSGDHFDALKIAGDLFPGKTLLSSECCSLHPPGQTSMFAHLHEDKTAPETVEYNDAAAYAHDIIGNLNAGMNRWIDWNICLDKNGGPRHVSGGFSSPIVVNDDGTYRKTITFDYIGHFSKYILPGAVRIASTRCDDITEMIAAKNPDGSIVAVFLNKTAKDQAYAIRMEGKIIRVKAPAKTISTVVMS